MNPAPKTADEILELVEQLPRGERERLLRRIQERRPRRLDPAVEASFEKARRITAKFKGSLADVVIAEREDRRL